VQRREAGERREGPAHGCGAAVQRKRLGASHSASSVSVDEERQNSSSERLRIAGSIEVMMRRSSLMRAKGITFQLRLMRSRVVNSSVVLESRRDRAPLRAGTICANIGA